MNVMRRTALAIALLFLFPCFIGLLQAQEKPRRASGQVLSDDGRYLAVQYTIGFPGENPNEHEHKIWLYDLEQPLKPPYLLQDGEIGGNGIVFSPDNALIAVGSYHGLSIYDMESKQSLLELENTVRDAWVDFRWIYFSPDSAYLMAFSDWWTRDHDMHIWQVATGQLVIVVDALRPQQWIERPWLSPNWKHFFRWHDDGDKAGTIYAFDPETGLGQVVAAIDTYGNGGAKFSPDSSLFAISTTDGEVQLYETETWTLKNSKQLLEFACDEYLSFSFSHSKSLLALTCPLDNKLSVWDYETGDLVFEVKTRGSGPRFSVDDSHLVVDTQFSGVHVWNIEQDFALTVYPGIYSRLHPNREIMISIGPDGYVWIWNIELEQLQFILPMFAG